MEVGANEYQNKTLNKNIPEFFAKRNKFDPAYIKELPLDEIVKREAVAFEIAIPEKKESLETPSFGSDKKQTDCELDDINNLLDNATEVNFSNMVFKIQSHENDGEYARQKSAPFKQ